MRDDFNRREFEWASDERYAEKVAFEIYPIAILDKKISKAILAQEFAHLLIVEEKKDVGKVKDALLKSPSLSYLINAICHVTEPLPKTKPDEDNRQ